MRVTGVWSGWVVLLTTVLMVLVQPWSPAAAAPESESPTGGSILVILDVSGSMDRTDPSGTRLIEGAREAVNQLVADLPPTTQVGLRLYGHGYAGDDPAQGCRDTELVVPIGPLARTGDRLRAAVRNAEPTGFTPIGAALASAADDFSGDGERSVVLVSDGEDTCGAPPPCRAARQLARQGVQVRVDTIGLHLQQNRAARRELSCIAEVTGGRFVDAESAAELVARLAETSQRALRRFEARGLEVDGGPAGPRASEIVPGQAYVDDVRPGESRWYSVPAGTGQVLAAELTEDGGTEYGCCLTVRLVDPEFDQMASEIASNDDGTATSFRLASSDQGVPAGEYYLHVELEPDVATAPVRYQFAVDVTGTALEDGRETETATPTATPEATATGEPSPTATDEAAAEQDVEATASSDGGDDSGGPWLWLALGLGMLVLAVAGVLVALLRGVRK